MTGTMPGGAREAAALLRVLEELEPAPLELLRTLVEVESHAALPDGVARVAEIVTEQLEPAGVTFERVPQPGIPEDHDQWIEEIYSPGRPYGSLADSWLGRRTGRGEPILLLADLDTAYPEDSLEQFPFQVRAGRAFGPGVADMKGGLVVLVAALRAIAALGLDAPPISIVLSGDEQAGSFGSRRLIEREAMVAAWCLSMECAREGGRLMRSRSQVGVGRLEARGREAHAGSAHGRGVNAIEGLARLVAPINALTRPDDGVFVTVTMMEGGRRRSVIPASAHAILDLRAPDAERWDAASNGLNALVSEAARRPGSPDLSLRLHAHRPAVPYTSRSRQLLDVVIGAGASLGLDLTALHSPAAGSSAFPGGLGVPTIDGLGPSGGGLMTDEEYVEISSLTERAALLCLLLHRLVRQGSDPRGGDHP